jgi:serine/threonine protein kinase
VKEDNTQPTETRVNQGHSDSGLFKTPTLVRGELFAGRYLILAKLGSGGMGSVYKARDIVVDRIVAVKIINSNFVGNEHALLVLQEEARSFARLSHKHLVKLHDFGVNNENEPYLVTEYIYGVTLDNVLRTQKTLEPGMCARIFTGVASGLNHAHEFGIVHKDFKPSNCILALTEDFPVKLFDFGIAQRDITIAQRDMSSEASISGTSNYMSPEHLNGHIVDSRSDQYSFGCTVYECLTGEVPLAGKTWLVTKYLRENEEPDFTKIPERFVPIVRKLLAKDPDKRLYSLSQAAQLLEEIGKETWQTELRA